MQVTPFQAPFNAQSDALEASLNGVAANFFLAYATKSAMVSEPGTRVRQHATVYADSTAANNGDYWWDGANWQPMVKAGTPVAWAAGLGSNTTAAKTVTFPAGRFTAPPIVTVTNTGAAVYFTNAQNITATQCVIAGYNDAGNAVSGATWMWIAVQMTPTSGGD